MSQEIRGRWGDDIQWEVLTAAELPPRDLITTAFCVAIVPGEQIVLARSKRGWGLLGGHIEAGETVAEALVRESLEEGGFTPSNPQLFAVMKITSKSHALRPNSAGEYYPFPVSYQTYYWATSDAPIVPPTGEEILESRSFSLPEIERLDIPDYQIIRLGYKAYLATK